MMDDLFFKMISSGAAAATAVGAWLIRHWIEATHRNVMLEVDTRIAASKDEMRKHVDAKLGPIELKLDALHDDVAEVAGDIKAIRARLDTR